MDEYQKPGFTILWDDHVEAYLERCGDDAVDNLMFLLTETFK